MRTFARAAGTGGGAAGARSSTPSTRKACSVWSGCWTRAAAPTPSWRASSACCLSSRLARQSCVDFSSCSRRTKARAVLGSTPWRVSTWWQPRSYWRAAHERRAKRRARDPLRPGIDLRMFEAVFYLFKVACTTSFTLWGFKPQKNSVQQPIGVWRLTAPRAGTI